MSFYGVIDHVGNAQIGKTIDYFTPGVDQNSPGTPLYTKTTQSLTGDVDHDVVPIVPQGMYDIRVTNSAATPTTRWETNVPVIKSLSLGVSDHTLLSNLSWTASGHTGTASRLAAFNGAGAASLIDYSTDWLSQYHNDSRALIWLGTRSTSDLLEGTNLYYTSARFDTAFSAKSTTNLSEGTNLYYTDERVDDRVSSLIQNGTGLTWTYDDTANTLTGNVSVTQYTDELAQDAVGGILLNTASVSLSYVDGTPSLSATVLPAGVDHNSLLNVGTGDVHTMYTTLTPTTSARNVIQSSDAAIVPLTLKGFASQSANIQEWQISTGTVATHITSAGNLDLNAGRLYGVYELMAEVNTFQFRNVNGVLMGAMTFHNIGADDRGWHFDSNSNTSASTGFTFDVGSATAAGYVFAVRDASDNHLFTIDAAECVGIGTATASPYKLNIQHTSTTVSPSAGLFVNHLVNTNAGTQMWGALYQAATSDGGAGLTLIGMECLAEDNGAETTGVVIGVKGGAQGGLVNWAGYFDAGNVKIVNTVVTGGFQLITTPTAGYILTSDVNGVGTWQAAPATYTDEQAQDAVGGMLLDTASVDLSYVDGTPSLSATVLPAGVDHNSLANLTTGDAHTMYLLAAGTRALTADWDAGSFEIRAQTFESDVVTGTAPLVIASTTKVTNLNSDLLDDQTGSYYLDSANFTGTNWTDLTDGGATTLHKHDHGTLDGLSDDDHTIYALLAGRAGGQTLKGGTAASETLTLQSTAHATRGSILAIDQVIGGTGSDYTLNPDVTDGASAIAYNFDTLNTLTTTAKIASFKNNGTEAFVVEDNGDITAKNWLYFGGAGAEMRIVSSAGLIYLQTAAGGNPRLYAAGGAFMGNMATGYYTSNIVDMQPNVEFQWAAVAIGSGQDAGMKRSGVNTLQITNGVGAGYGKLTVLDDAYAAGWDGSQEVPTKNAIYDKIQTLQPLDSDLTTIAGLTATSDNFIQSVSSAWASRTPTEVTATLIGMTGDAGAGGLKGLVPAQAIGDATKYLRGDGTWQTVAGSGDMVLASAQTNSGIKTFLDTTLKLRNVANTFDGYFVNTNTADRIYTLKDAAGTLAFTSDITGTNSNTNTGDQTIANSSDATSHTVTLSASGGTIQFIEGTNITLTTGGTAGAGTLTIAAAGGGTDPAFSTLAPTGSITIAAGTGVVVPDHYTIANGQTLTIENGAYLMIL